MSYETVDYSVEDGVARVALNRPNRLNSFTVDMHEELADCLDAIEATIDTRAILLTGNGRGFCAGQDLAERKVKPGSAPVDLAVAYDKYWAPLIKRLAMRDKPVVCAVNGIAAGAGANVALACDIVIAARSATFIQSFANVGLMPDSGGTWVLPRKIGQARALWLALTADRLSAEKAEQWGLIWQCVDDAELEAESMRIAIKLAKGPTRGFAAAKQAIRGSGQHSLSDALAIERELIRELGFSADYQEGVASFLEKRSPQFSGH